MEGAMESAQGGAHEAIENELELGRWPNLFTKSMRPFTSLSIFLC